MWPGKDAKAADETPTDKKVMEKAMERTIEKHRRRQRWRKAGIVLAGVGAAALATSFKIVRPTEVGLVERLGAYSRTLHPGPNFIIPGVERLHRVNTQTQAHAIEPCDVITQDRARVKVTALVLIRIMDPVKAFYGLKNSHTVFPSMAQGALRNTLAQFLWMQTNSERPIINQAFEKAVQTKGEQWGIVAESAELLEVQPEKDLQGAMTRVLVEENARVAADQSAKAANILAEGEKQAEIRRAEGRAQAMELEAGAKAKALHIVNSAVSQSFTPGALAYRQLEAAETALKGSNTRWIIPQDNPLLSNLFSLMQINQTSGGGGGAVKGVPTTRCATADKTSPAAAGQASPTGTVDRNQEPPLHESSDSQSQVKQPVDAGNPQDVADKRPQTTGATTPTMQAGTTTGVPTHGVYGAHGADALLSALGASVPGLLTMAETAGQHLHNLHTRLDHKAKTGSESHQSHTSTSQTAS
jgi:regulator of protease activity HflC (stomatin/prohibitin superfamily)